MKDKIKAMFDLGMVLEEIRKIDQQIFPNQKIRGLAIIIVLTVWLVPNDLVQVVLTTLSAISIAILRGAK